MINKDIGKQFYEGKRSTILPFVINDAVEVLEGEYKGRGAAVISVEEIEPEAMYLIELGDGSGDVRIHAKYLKLVKGQ